MNETELYDNAVTLIERLDGTTRGALIAMYQARLEWHRRALERHAGRAATALLRGRIAEVHTMLEILNPPQFVLARPANAAGERVFNAFNDGVRE